MKTRTTPGRLLLLLVLLGTGLGMIWHIGHTLAPQAATATSVRNASPQALPQPAQSRVAADSAAGRSTASKQEVAPVDVGKDKSQAKRQTAALPAGAKGEPAQPGTQVQKSSSGADLKSFFKELQERPGLPRLVVSARGSFIATETILFNTGKTTLRSASNQTLDKLADLLKQRPEIKLEIIGHTDKLGVESNNLRLSTDRAAAVREYLVKRGIDTSRLEVKGMGSAMPVASNDSRLGRQANRRIEFLITSPK